MTDEDEVPRGDPDDSVAEGDRPALANERDVDSVYQPAEDSRLLATTVSDRLGGDEFVLDIGTGSGYVAARLQEASGARVLGSDLNPAACAQARAAGVPVVCANMFGPFVANSFDVVVSNPPYLPTPPEREWDDWMEAALSGGADGRAMVRPFLRGVGRVLAPEGRAYLLISTLTDPEAVRELAASAGLTTAELARESYPFEELLVLEFTAMDESD